MKIIVTGSLGHISKPLTEALVQKGYKVTVISSNPDKQSAIQGLGATAAIGSIQDAGFLVNTFRGADAVYTMVPPVSYFDPTLDPIAYFRTIGNNYAQAIRQTGIKRVVNLSSWGAHLDKGNGGIAGAYHLEQILNELPDEVSITHMRPTSFYYNLFSFVPAIKSAGIMAANYGGEDRTVLVAPSDIAAAVTQEFETPAVGRQVRYVASDELSCNEVARILGETIGKPDLKWIVVPAEQMLNRLEAAGMPPHMARSLVELQAGHHSGIIAEDYYRNRPVALGKVKTADFAREFAAAFHQK
ncbi:NmrA family NAD(P)-binding protein [Larkinella rosea]|uniref:NAD-dependent epimerase/dehydratase family protein n=1 Tax=Larkinella rosea TaxID=2025312 RepID=A0A3P1BAS0_9BACT|nr:NmrA family NAD(P)-binding protein [Larkinella rosea]RRA98119.1 NAD-dependent epimerase/dehydratase family protein [Larkinella rosea]